MGGKAASYFAVQTSNRPFLNKLIVEDVVPTRGSNFPLFLRYVETLQKLNLNKPRKEILVDLENLVPDLKVRQFLLTNLVSIGPDQFRWKINLVGIGNYLPEILEFKLENGSFDGKTLFLYGEKSEFFETRDKDSIRKFFPNVVFKSVDAGHWIHAEKPDLFVSSVVDFLLGN
jgi:pimeloyl-ACP methyl ester carboxylesterase